MQGTQNNGDVAGGAVDLDALLASRLLEPTPLKLGGKTWKLRTDLTGIEVGRALAFYRTGEYEGLLTLLFGDRKEIAALNAALDERKAVEQAAKDSGATVEYGRLPYAKAAIQITRLLEQMPRMHSALALANILRASKALAEFALDDDTIHGTYNYVPGESSAS